MRTDLVLKIIGALLVVVAVAAAGYFAGTFLGKRISPPKAPSHALAPRSDLARRVTALSQVTEVVEGQQDGEVLLFVVVDADQLAGEEARQARGRFLESLSGAVADEISPEQIRLVARQGGEVLQWHLEDRDKAAPPERGGAATSESASDTSGGQ